MHFKFGNMERRSLRLYCVAPPKDVRGCTQGVEYLEKCMDRICLAGNDGECDLRDDINLIIETLKALRVRNMQLERLALQLYKLHPSLIKPLIGQLY